MSEETTQNPMNTANEESAVSESNEPVKAALFDEGEPENQESEASKPEDNVEAAQPERLKAEDITIPEGAEYDAELGNSFLEIINDEKLSRKDLAQKLFDLYQSQSMKMLDGLKAADKESSRQGTRKEVCRRHSGGKSRMDKAVSSRQRVRRTKMGSVSGRNKSRL